MADLLSPLDADRPRTDYGAHDIEVLEGLEPVRRRPGMYVGGTDERALHHLVAEVLDNSMDEAVAGFASRIEIELAGADRVTIRDNGRGIPVEPHPRFPDKSALEVVMTTLHAGGKFSQKAYQTSGGLHGVGVSVVNALAAELVVEVARDRRLYEQRFAQGRPLSPVREIGPAPNRRGTSVSFTPDRSIFNQDVKFRPHLLHRMARSKAYLFRGVEIRWRCDPALIEPDHPVPAAETFHFPDGLGDFLKALTQDRALVVDEPFTGEAELAELGGRVEWAVAWPVDEEPYTGFYCNTVPTPQGGTHEAGLRGALLKGLKAHAERTGHRRSAQVTAEDVLGGCCQLLSVFIREPQFQGQTKEKLVSVEVTRAVETCVKDRFELWLAQHPPAATRLLDHLADRAEERLARRRQKEVQRKTETRKLRLPGKLADCTRDGRDGTEIFIVEGDSAGGSAKQARSRETQAILPLRGKILNAVSASADKLAQNKELMDLVTALGCGSGKGFRLDELRYEKVIVMTDADVDGAHIAALLVTFFYQQMPGLIDAGHLFLAQPPLYRLSHGGTTAYARDEQDRERLLATVFKGKKNVETGRFKGLGEMNPQQLRETTMDPAKRRLLQVRITDLEGKSPGDLVDELMGKKPELRLAFIQANARFAADLDV